MRTPGLTLVLLLSIALGIGSDASMYGFVRGLTKPESPLTSVDRLVSIFERDAHGEAGPVSYQQYLSLKAHGSEFEWIGVARISPGSVAMAGQSAIVSVAAVTSNLASALNLSLQKGVFISHRMWQNEFGAGSNIQGGQIRIDGFSTRLSGVTPNWLEGLYRDHAVDLWMPLPEKTLQEADRQRQNFWVLARLRRDVSIIQAQSAVRPSRGASSEILVLPYTGMTPETAEDISRIGTLLDFAAGTVFLIACANIISFLLGRAFARSHETSVRVALGASRSQLAWGLLWDSIVISVAGGAFGTVLAMWTARVVPALLFDQDAEHLIFAPGLFSIVAASAACASITVLCGLMPFFATRDDRPETVLRRERGGPSKVMRRLRASLVVVQMTSCCVLVISTAFLLDGLRSRSKRAPAVVLGIRFWPPCKHNPLPASDTSNRSSRRRNHGRRFRNRMGGVFRGTNQRGGRSGLSHRGCRFATFPWILPGSPPTRLNCSPWPLARAAFSVSMIEDAASQSLMKAQPRNCSAGIPPAGLFRIRQACRSRSLEWLRRK